MLPVMPAAFGNLRDVFRSAEQSVLGAQNAFGLGKVDSAIVIMVDGLGFENMKQASDFAPALSSAKSELIFSDFPSTTAVSITSFATGERPSEHGFFGYRIYDRSRKESVNLLSGLDQYSVLDYLRSDSISETSVVDVHAVTLEAYADSGMTRATMHGAEHHFADSISERFRLARQLAVVSNRLIYVYVPELDQAAHRFGVASAQWRELLKQLDLAVADLVVNVDTGVGILLTADHGIVDVPQSQHIYLDLVNELDRNVVDVGGDPRVAFVYLTQQANPDAIRQALAEHLGNRGTVATPAELVNANLWQSKLLDEDDLLPDLVLIAIDDVAFYHREFAKPTSLKMIGQHGALSDVETRIPLIKLAGY